MNSNFDDFSFIIDKENKYGYLSSNRDGGRGDDDIYYFTKAEKPCTQWLAGRVPVVGILLRLVDILAIFRPDRRCIHDHLAKTKVIDLRIPVIQLPDAAVPPSNSLIV